MANPTTNRGAIISVAAQAVAAPVLSAPATSGTGGTLAAATYYYKATYTTASGALESLPSNEVSEVTTGSTSTVTFTLGAAPAGATGMNIYRSTSAGSEVLVYSNVATATSFTDTGSGTPGTQVPPTAATAYTGYNSDLTKSAAAALSYTEIGKVGKIGQHGYKTNMIAFSALDTILALKAKGETDGGDLTIEAAEDLSDAGQNLMIVIANPKNVDNFVVKVAYANGDTRYIRGPVGGPMYNGGGNQDFRTATFNLGVNQIIS